VLTRDRIAAVTQPLVGDDFVQRPGGA